MSHAAAQDKLGAILATHMQFAYADVLLVLVAHWFAL